MNDLSKLKDYIDLLKKEHNMSVAPLCDSLGLSPIAAEIASDEINIVDRVKRYLELNRDKDITSEDICRHIGCSRSLVSHQFKARTGMGIREYLTMLRLEDAKILLENSNLTITEIAFTVGFGSSNYFTNVFKKDTGMAPGEYRKRCRKSNWQK